MVYREYHYNLGYIKLVVKGVYFRGLKFPTQLCWDEILPRFFWGDGDISFGLQLGDIKDCLECRRKLEKGSDET